MTELAIVFSKEQHEQIGVLVEAMQSGQRVLVFTGPAGSGKTTCMQEFARRVRALGWKCAFLAPTGKAALRLKQVTKEPTNTVHAVLFAAVRETEDGDPVFLNPRPPCKARTVLIIDEASMVDTDLHRDLCGQLPESSVIVYVGDRDQLPPVLGDWGPDFDHPTAVLTQVHRQALNSPIIRISVDVRNGGKLPAESIGTKYLRFNKSLDRVATWVAGEQDEGHDVVVLCWTNKTRQKLNRLMRRIQGLDSQGPLVPTDRVLVLQNNRRLGRMNGEVCGVEAVTPFEDSPAMERANDIGIPPSKLERGSLYIKLDNGTKCFVHPDLIGVPYNEFKAAMRGLSITVKERWLHMDYGYALTVHKSQASEWATVAFVIDRTTRFLAAKDPRQARHLVYTGLTRAKERLVVFDVD